MSGDFPLNTRCLSELFENYSVYDVSSAPSGQEDQVKPYGGNMQYHYIVEGQPGSELFTFVVSAQDLSSFAKLERFNETQEGVERKLNYSHVLKLAEFMRQPNASLAEPVLGDLRGKWQVDRDGQLLRRENGAALLVDDGQHRLAALQLLSDEERSRWQFKVTAKLNTPYQVRLRRFLQQLMRLKLDTHLVWQIQDRGDLFPDSISKASYQLAKRRLTNRVGKQ